MRRRDWRAAPALISRHAARNVDRLRAIRRDLETGALLKDAEAIKLATTADLFFDFWQRQEDAR